MDDKFLAQLVAEMMEAQTRALEILARAIGESGAPEILAASVRAALAEQRRRGPLPGGLEILVNGVLRGLEEAAKRGATH